MKNFLSVLLLALSIEAQHWSRGFHPQGKRSAPSVTNSEIPKKWRRSLDPEIAATFPGGVEAFLKKVKMEANEHRGREAPTQFLKRIADLQYLTDDNDDFSEFPKRFYSRGYNPGFYKRSGSLENKKRATTYIPNDPLGEYPIY